MEKERAKDLALGVFILAIAAGGFLFVNPTDAPVTPGPGGITWRTLPWIYSGLLLALSLVFIATTFLAPSGSSKAVEESAEPAVTAAADEAADEQEPLWLGLRRSTARRVLIVLSLILYTQALEAFGFALATPVFLLALLYLFGRRDLRENLLTSFAGGFVLWLLFVHFLHMPLRGSLWDPVTPLLTGSLKALGV